MILLSDNDIVLKLVLCDLIEEALAALEATRDEVYILPTAKYKLGVAKNPEKTRSRIGEAVFERLRDFIDSVQVISSTVSPKEQRIFDDLVGIDPGEAVLFSATTEFDEFLLATGDKNSLRALAASLDCKRICKRLAGKVVCFEQLVLRIIDQAGFDLVRDRVVPARSCDTALRAVFGSGLDSTEANVRGGLDFYITDLRRNAGILLIE